MSAAIPINGALVMGIGLDGLNPSYVLAVHGEEIGMGILLFDPVCETEAVKRQTELTLDGLKGKKVGYVFNQHYSALTFWETLEREIERELNPSAVHRVYKKNTFAPAPAAELEQLIRKTDYALVGVGA